MIHARLHRLLFEFCALGWHWVRNRGVPGQHPAGGGLFPSLTYGTECAYHSFFCRYAIIVRKVWPDGSPKRRLPCWAILVQESWLHVNLDDNTIHLDGYNILWSERSFIIRTGGVGIIMLICCRWCTYFSLLVHLNRFKINCTSNRYKPFYLDSLWRIIFCNVYKNVETEVHNFKQITNELSEYLILYVDRSLCFTPGNVNKFDIYHLLAFSVLCSFLHVTIVFLTWP